MRTGTTVEPSAVRNVDDNGSTARPRGPRSIVQFAVLALPVAAFVVGGWAHRWITDDGFIYMRVVQQIRAGNGPVFNEGERVEAFTGTLWVAILSMADLVTPIRLEWLVVALGLVGGATGIWLAICGARELCRPVTDGAFLVPFGAVVFVALLPTWVFATSGLETGLTFAWIGGCLYILGRWAASPGERLSIPRAIVLGLGWLVRPELVLFSAAFLLLTLVGQWRRDRFVERVRLVGAMVALPVAYQVFRMGYYGSLVPNTAIAKEGGGGGQWDRGWRYLSDFADPYWLWVPAVTLLIGGYLPLVSSLLRLSEVRRCLVVVAVLLVGLVVGAYIVAVGGDYIHARLMLPAFFAVCSPVAVVPTTRRHLASLLAAPWVVVAVFWLRPAQYETGNWLARGFALPKSPGKVTIDDYGWGRDGPSRQWYTGPAYYYQSFGPGEKYVRADIPVRHDVDTPVAALGGIGIVSYALGPDLHVLDIHGLADTLTAHMETSSEQFGFFPRLPGHEKPLPAPWSAALLTSPGSRADEADIPSVANPLIAPTSGAEFQEQVAWARAALRCDEIVKLRRAADAPLTAGRFVDNVRRSFTNTRLRIPPDPEEAYHKFCGPGTPREVRDVRDGL